VSVSSVSKPDPPASLHFLRLAGPVAEPDALAELTTRERQVLILIAHGLSNTETADSLHLSGATIKTHVAHLYRKPQARDRAQAAISPTKPAWSPQSLAENLSSTADLLDIPTWHSSAAGANCSPEIPAHPNSN
jgi:DNA-binding CsgD family transcriptional regulator